MLFGVVGAALNEHDVKLVVLAAAICAFACYTALHMLSRASAIAGHTRPLWIGAAASALGAGVWAANFVAMLAFRASATLDFDLSITLASLALAICFSFGAFALFEETRSAPLGPIGAALILAAGIGGLHYIGVTALVSPGLPHFQDVGVAISIAAGALLAWVGLEAFRRGHLPASAALLALAMCTMHFIGAASVRIEAPAVNAASVSSRAGLLALAVAAAAFLVLALGLIGSMLDRRLAARATLDKSRWREFADASFEGILFEADGLITDANAALGSMLGRAPETVLGHELEAVFDGRTAQRLRQPLKEGVPRALEGELLCSDGGIKPIEVLRRPIAGPGRRVVLAVRDLSERRTAQGSREHPAHHDPLTGLPNRAMFDHRLAQATALAERTGRGFALLFLDLDDFGAINETLGFAAADQVLAQVARRIAETVRGTDTTARVGGDQFAVLHPLASQPGAASSLATRLLADLCSPYEIEGRAVRVGVSVGIALHGRDGDNPELLARNAEAALGRAKQEGRGVFRFFEPEMNRALQERGALAADLRDALGRGELTLQYQPLFRGETLALCGYEALLRWTHPDRGAISPVEFIPLAEECGLIEGVGRWMLDQACAEAARWPAGLRIAVNLSPVQFRQTDLVGAVAATLHRHRLDPSRLELEITEGVLIDDADRALAVLRQLKALGVRTALDDFGSGYSSLSFLRRFRFDKLKIERSLIQGLGEDPDADATVPSIIAIGQSLRLDVTAKGVETESQLARLRALGCSQIQGFLLGRPCVAPDHRADAPSETSAPTEA